MPHSSAPPLLTVVGDTLVAADRRMPPPARRRGPLAPYRRIFAAPGAVAFTLAGALARLPMSMLGVATVLLIALERDSYALAGAVSATGVAVTAGTAPLLGRLVDRHGQARVAVPAVLVFATGTACLLLCVHYGAPDWALLLSCAGSSGAPGIGAMTRARWTHLHRDSPALRHVAGSFEQVLDELCFMTGPVLAMLLCTLVAPEAGLLTAAVLLTAGTLLFAAQRATEPPVHPRPHGRSAGPLRVPGLGVLLAVLLATGALFGSMEVATIAAVDALGGTAPSSAVLALQAAGSAAAGLVFGALRLRAASAGRLVTGVAAMALGVLPLTAADVLPALAAGLFLAGTATAPTMVTGMALVQQLMPEARLNEGMTTAYTALLVGIAAGAAAGGRTVEHLGPGAGYWVPALAGALALTIAAAGAGRLRRGLRHSPGSPPEAP
ncbi:MFS transporter [Streptomyces sp. NPDC001922]|uniref:MFS transporter n=1 Tax=Streptomyces sp. NPDC001922 TaxID=3364624 RepID=UPI0036ADD518